MTKEEREQRKNIADQERAVRENERLSQQLSKEKYKRDARFKALEVAQYINVSPKGVNPPEPQANRMNEDRIIDVSEKIYQWLIKVIK